MDVEKANYQYSLAAARAGYAYLPSDELIKSLGYEHHHLGRYHKRVQQHLYVISVFSQSNRFVLQIDGEALYHQLIHSDEQLLAFLKANNFG